MSFGYELSRQLDLLSTFDIENLRFRDGDDDLDYGAVFVMVEFGW